MDDERCNESGTLLRLDKRFEEIVQEVKEFRT
jgi:hypothetical protein